ncbi:MAG: hypothetical protein HY699_10335 [Deltaproteobacteria bacterium]|nr:hypothetical protein [Deltaproteobacteria bacterium]
MSIRSAVCAGLLALVLNATAVGHALAADRNIDDFRSGSPHRGLRQEERGSKARSEARLLSVIGGQRRLTITATEIGLADVDAVSTQLEPTGALLNYASSEGADGKLELSYDAGGRKLGLDVSANLSLKVLVADSDEAAVPYSVTLTLTDQSGRKAGATQVVSAPGPQTVDFRLANFPRLDRRRLAAITVVVDPQPAGDLQLSRIWLTQ